MNLVVPIDQIHQLLVCLIITEGTVEMYLFWHWDEQYRVRLHRLHWSTHTPEGLHT